MSLNSFTRSFLRPWFNKFEFTRVFSEAVRLGSDENSGPLNEDETVTDMQQCGDTCDCRF